MARVSLIVLRAPKVAWPAGRVAACRAGLEERGHEVEVLVVTDPRSGPEPGGDEPGCRRVACGWPGLSELAVAGLREARGDLLVVLDLAMAYAPEDVLALVAALDLGDAELAVAARRRPLTGPAAFRLLGTADPSSGLVGLTRAAMDEADDSFAPVGSRFALEILARVGGRRVDVPVGPVASPPRSSPRFDDVRMAKRLSDDQFGNASRLIQFCFVGASGMVVDLTCYAALQMILSYTPLAGREAPVVGGSLVLATSAVLAVATALTWNFSINRRLTFNDARGGSIVPQYLRYVLSNLLGIAVSLTLRLALPRTVVFFARHRLAAAVVGIVAATGISFTMARWFVFGKKPVADGAPAKAPAVRRRCAGFRPAARGTRARVNPGPAVRVDA